MPGNQALCVGSQKVEEVVRATAAEKANAACRAGWYGSHSDGVALGVFRCECAENSTSCTRPTILSFRPPQYYSFLALAWGQQGAHFKKIVFGLDTDLSKTGPHKRHYKLKEILVYTYVLEKIE